MGRQKVGDAKGVTRRREARGQAGDVAADSSPLPVELWRDIFARVGSTHPRQALQLACVSRGLRTAVEAAPEVWAGALTARLRLVPGNRQAAVPAAARRDRRFGAGAAALTELSLRGEGLGAALAVRAQGRGPRGRYPRLTTLRLVDSGPAPLAGLQHLMGLRQLTLFLQATPAPSAWARLAPLAALRSLTLMLPDDASAATLGGIATLSQLTELRLQASTLPAAGAAALAAGATALRSLALEVDVLTAAALDPLTGLRALSALDLGSHVAGDWNAWYDGGHTAARAATRAALAALLALPALCSLCLMDVAELPSLRLPRLQQLHLDCALTRGVLGAAGPMPQLTSLVIGGDAPRALGGPRPLPLSDADLAWLGQQDSLRALYVGAPWTYCAVTARLTGLTALTSLDLVSLSCSKLDTAVACLADMRGLRRLRLGLVGFPWAGDGPDPDVTPLLDALGDLESLQALRLDGVILPPGPRALEPLRPLRTLRLLVLGIWEDWMYRDRPPPQVDAVADAVGQLTQLTGLACQGGWEPGATGLGELARLTSLKHLRLLPLWAMSAAALSPLAQLTDLQRLEVRARLPLRGTALRALRPLHALTQLRFCVGHGVSEACAVTQATVRRSLPAPPTVAFLSVKEGEALDVLWDETLPWASEDGGG